ncbi:MAG: hypothetical protein HDR03_10735 [Lachnospiraceae bacterium]|nr:hypothetical protein [Lachnospiraceae bacterium]
MTYKKNWLSYILWAIYTCITGVMLAEYTMLLWKKQINLTTRMYMIGFVFLFFVMVAGLFFLLKKVGAETLCKNKISEHTKLMWEIFAVLCIFVTALLYRLYMLIQIGTDTVIDTHFYDMAIVGGGADTEPLVHGASYIYVQFLSLVFSFLGNKIMAAVWMQFFIEMLTILLSFFVIRKLLGSIPACMVMLILTLSGVYNSRILMVTPELLFFLLYLIGLYIVGSYVKAYCSNRLSKPMMIAGALFSGIIIGVLVYLDAISLTIFIIMAGLITGIDTKPDRKKVTPYLLFLLTVIGAFLAMSGAFILDSYASGDTIEAILNAWLDLYRIHLQKDTIIYQNKYSLAECLIQVVLAALLILSFCNRRKVQNSTPWMCLMFLLAPMPLSSVGVLDYQVYYVFIWSVLAGLGLQQSLVAGDDGAQYTSAEIENVEEDKRDMENIKDSDDKSTATNINVEPIEPISKPESETEPGPAPKPEPESAPKPRFIENPLPLPKKHEKRDMDYQYEVAEDKMKFDIEVDDNDDFDK